MAIHELTRPGTLHAKRLSFPRPTPLAMRCRKKFLHYFPGGFQDDTYVEWERGYKLAAHERWNVLLGRGELRALLRAGEFREVAARAVTLESRTNLLFSFEKMALRDAVRSRPGARAFAEGLFDFVYGRGSTARRFERWCAVVAELPRKQTRVLTWPLVTVFGFLAQPREHIFMKPNVTRRAAKAYGFDFHYHSRPSFGVYAEMLAFAEVVKRDTADLRPRDMIDVQSFLWVQGSDEYPA